MKNRSAQKDPRLTLVGAGPGDPELITLKAIKALQAADMVLYDALVSQPILELIPAGVPAFSVGKRAGGHSYTQEEINELIVEFAFQYGHVVRLKGGDPFVFGRGAEELDFAESHGVQTAVVPGISSALAVPASLQIPVTARGYSESVWVVTATTRTGALSGDIALAAQSTATVVILMGLGRLPEIMKQFEAQGKGAVPVAVIQNGTLPEQQSVIGTVTSIAARAAEAGIGAPAIIIVGEVVRYARALKQVVVATKSMA
ncbi:uroporphyrinogen-III C-methyltransferase [Dawidia soli]|uniref:uroporphyrinogen-III C-methyltransferase n=1 Tax=Dawidia soli TaxID=2782352 RepID=A0AAP2DAR4_9BACT|nr:uroporphyrinogen-III C-methyltransferase [Dawidia soli]MBT1688546.1 uroporphyrinogen-III C-methyltransferase [Dawidia soli]